jgi:hypothetical protein
MKKIDEEDEEAQEEEDELRMKTKLEENQLIICCRPGRTGR